MLLGMWLLGHRRCARVEIHVFIHDDSLHNSIARMQGFTRLCGYFDVEGELEQRGRYHQDYVLLNRWADDGAQTECSFECVQHVFLRTSFVADQFRIGALVGIRP
jgi:hypothetical protein